MTELYNKQDVLNQLITDELTNGKVKGIINLNDNVASWTAKVIDSKPEVGSYNELTSSFTDGSSYLFLYEVEVKFERWNVNNYKFVRVVWKDKKE